MTRACLILATLACALALAIRPAWAEAPPPLETLMADPAWIGPPVEAAWWQLDGQAIVYRTGREASDVKDLRQVDLATGEDRLLALEAHDRVHGETPLWCQAHEQAVYSREGNLFLYRRADGELRQLTRGPHSDQDARFSADAAAILFRRETQWWQVQLDTGLAWPVTDLRFERDPDAAPEDGLAATQLRLFSSLRADAERAREQREHAIEAARADRTRAAAPWYLGDEYRLADSSLSPDGRWLLAVVEPAKHDAGRRGRMPHYVTVEGYVDIEEVRTRVGRNPPAPQTLWLLDLHTRERHVIPIEGLAGIDVDPLADLKAAQDLEPLGKDELRPVSVLGLAWHPAGTLLALQLRANDNKDRWLAVLDPESRELRQRHRLTDEAWINWVFNEFGWIPGGERLWFLSEGSGYSHLYSVDARRGAPRAHTSGRFEVMAPQLLADGRTMLLLSNRSHPTEYDLYRVDLQGDTLERLSHHRGIESFAVLPDETRVLVRYSEPYLPAQAALVSLADGSLTALTDTRSARFREIDWQAPEIVGVPSSHGAGTVWAKFYPARGEPPTPAGHPAVLFVHGAGYLQNVHHRYPQYFREQMFHTLLTARGYHVLDMDFRATPGDGRAWRPATAAAPGLGRSGTARFPTAEHPASLRPCIRRASPGLR
ncbi:MAG: DPP IV N-terminal domain-containing protein [Gammaproteobacteria bacterium]|nr:DPP IV N-terminal domain-containing protein [Gammaproteobacteria bacterium]